MSASEAKWHTYPIRVRYQETDAMGVVFHGNYVTWFEVGRTEWIRANGYSYRSIEERGLLLPVVDLQCKYILPARYDDEIVICTRIGDFSPLRLSFESQIRRVSGSYEAKVLRPGEPLPGELLVEGGTKHVWVNANWQPARVNKALPELYELLKGQ